jgi:deoxyribonuclease-1
MESDIYNIVPANGAINALRSNFSMAELDNKNTEICLGVYIGHRKFMPNIKQKGNVARIYMYMDQTYPGRGIISDKNKKLFEAWDKIDPVDKEECELTRLKEKYQKNKNMIILDRCTKLSL